MEVVDDDPVTSQEGAKHGGLEHGTRSADPHASSVVWRQSAATHPETVLRLQSAFDQWNRELPRQSILPAQRSTVIEMHGETVQLIF